MDTEALRQSLKDRAHGNSMMGDFEQGRGRMEAYIKALEKELNKRRSVMDLLNQASKYYNSLLGEAEIVATAYTNFGKRIKNLKTKLQGTKLFYLRRQYFHKSQFCCCCS